MHPCNTLILTGALFDIHTFRNHRPSILKVMQFFSGLADLTEKYNTEVVVVQDRFSKTQISFLDLFASYALRTDHHILQHGSEHILVLQGEIAGLLETRIGKWLSHFEGGRRLLHGIQKALDVQLEHHPIWEANQVPEYYSVTTASSLADYAKAQGYQGIIASLSEQALIQSFHEVRYMCSGNWSLFRSALVDDVEHGWSIVYYKETDALSSTVGLQPAR